MKTVPYLYFKDGEKTEVSVRKTNIDSRPPNIMTNRKSEFSNLFHSDSPFRYMKVHTDLMEEMGIQIGDLVVIDPTGIPETGKIVIVNVDDTLMIRRYEKMRNGFVLHAENQKVAALKIESGYIEVSLIGVIIYVIKSL